MPRILQGAARSEVERLCRSGDVHAEAGEHAEALACLLEAWELLPEPREAYEAAGSILAGLARVLGPRGAPGGLDLLLGGRRHVAPPLARLGAGGAED